MAYKINPFTGKFDDSFRYFLDVPVWDDIQFSVSGAKVPAANFPNWEAFTTNTNEYAFDVNEYIDCGANEVPHGWQEGTDASVHLHIAIKTANSSGASQYAKFTVFVAFADVNEVWTEITPLTSEQTIENGAAALKQYLLTSGTLSMPNNLIGTQVKLRVQRIAATGGAEYADSIFITQAGIHFKQNTIGSESIATK